MELAGMIGYGGLAIVLALIALLPRKGSIENTRLDQLQEDLGAERKERKALGAELKQQAEEVKTLRLEVTLYRGRDIAWFDHYSMIQRGVETGTVPPWPELPESLRSE